MSFLNPVNEPVKRFSSTDAGAPQVNYNSRVAGDVKAIIKACLVTGYGSKASAGWSMVNEVSNVAEFVSPIAAMSDYRFGIDDSGNVQFYYTYNDVKTAPSSSVFSKGFSNNDRNHANNGWQLIVTARGFVFVELAQSTSANGVLSRVTYVGANKQITDGSGGRNISCFTVGLNAPTGYPASFFSSPPAHSFIDNLTPTQFFGPIYTHITSDFTQVQRLLTIDSAVYLANKNLGVLGQLPPIFTRCGNAVDFAAIDVMQEELQQACLQVALGAYQGSSVDTHAKLSVFVLIPLETWGF